MVKLYLMCKYLAALTKPLQSITKYHQIYNEVMICMILSILDTKSQQNKCTNQPCPDKLYYTVRLFKFSNKLVHIKFLFV